MNPSSRQGEIDDRPLVAFDFDGTLTVRDSFAAFLAWRRSPWRLAEGIVRLAPAAVRWLIDRDRGRLKSAAVHVFLGGRTPAQVSEAAEAFASEARLLRSDALACWADWGGKGARRVIVTASPELLVAPFARRLGAEALIGTRLEIDAAGRLTGALMGRNCRGPEKVARLREAFGPHVRLAAAYGDSAGDREMLALAQTVGLKVFTGRP
jgi:phosphatidylglycerophosphatase C